MIDLRHVEKRYRAGSLTVAVLRDVSLQIGAGEFVAIMGPSGSGKSTLLNIVGLLDRYEAGAYYFNGALTDGLSETGAARWRGRSVGFIFQSFHLLPFKSAVENVALPLFYQGLERRERERRAHGLLDRLGLSMRAHHLPSELSGGQRQRVAIARALVTDPPLILADEPTGSLDSASAHEVLDLVADMHREGRTIIMVTHEASIAARAQRLIRLDDGCIVEDRSLRP